MRRGEAADPEQRDGHWDIGLLCERAQQRRCPGDEDAVAGEDHRALGAIDEGRGSGESILWRWGRDGATPEWMARPLPSRIRRMPAERPL